MGAGDLNISQTQESAFFGVPQPMNEEARGSFAHARIYIAAKMTDTKKSPNLQKRLHFVSSLPPCRLVDSHGLGGINRDNTIVL